MCRHKLVTESGTDDSTLFKLSNRVRGSGMVGEMGTLITEAFRKVIQSAGKSRRAILIIDEGDSLGASRAQLHSHHEDKVAVNTLIQGVDDLRKYEGRIVVILCSNRLAAVDPALRRRAAIIEELRVPRTKSAGNSFRWTSRASPCRRRSYRTSLPSRAGATRSAVDVFRYSHAALSSRAVKGLPAPLSAV